MFVLPSIFTRQSFLVGSSNSAVMLDYFVLGLKFKKNLNNFQSDDLDGLDLDLSQLGQINSVLKVDI